MRTGRSLLEKEAYEVILEIAKANELKFREGMKVKVVFIGKANPDNGVTLTHESTDVVTSVKNGVVKIRGVTNATFDSKTGIQRDYPFGESHREIVPLRRAAKSRLKKKK